MVQLDKQPIRRLLLVAYCGTAFCVFFVICTLSVVLLVMLRDTVLAESEEALRNQIYLNSGHLLTESGEVFSAKLTTGLQTLALPAAYAVADVHFRGDSYSTRPSRSYADTSVNHLEQDELRTSVGQFMCNPSESIADANRRGCINGLRQYSTGTSSCYLSDVFPYNDDWVTYSYPSSSDDELDTYAAYPLVEDGVRTTAMIDDFVRAPFESMTGWNGAYVALDSVSSANAGSSRLFRQYPGFVGDLSHAGGYRTYDPRDRAWFSSHISKPIVNMDNDDLGQYEMEVTEPYLDSFGNGYLISITASIPRSSGAFTGVAGTDILVEPLLSIVGDLKLRQTGEVHLYHTESETVAASPQWSAAVDGGIMGITDVKLDDEASATATIPSGSACDGHVEVDDHLIIRRPAWDGEYCLAAVIKIAEVVGPIVDQKEDIESAANGLILMVVAIIVCCFFLLVMPCTVLLSAQLSKPLVETSRQSRIMARNIGGDLLQDVWIDAGGSGTKGQRMVRAGEEERKRCLDGGIGEVTELRAGFVNTLAQLQGKRDTPPTPALNPLYTKVLPDEQGDDADPNAPAGAVTSLVEEKFGQVTVQYCDPTLQRKNTLMEIPPTRCHNQISVRLVLQLVLPLAVALFVIVVVTTALMLSKTSEWIGPVTDMMVQEELTSLNLRCQQRAELVTETVDSAVNTLLMVQAYATLLYSGSADMLLHAGYNTAFAGVSCPSGGSTCNFNSWSRDSDEERVPGRQINLEHSAWYAPSSAAAPSSQRQPSSVVSDVGDAYLDQQYQDTYPNGSSLASHLDNVARVAYFSSDVTDIYFGWESNEAYRIYPYRYLESWYWEPKDATVNGWVCGRVDEGYTPLCRDWYQDAVTAEGDPNYGTVALDPDSNQPFVPLSAAFYDSDNKLVGVAAISLGLGSLKRTLENTPLYEGGYAYIFDENGNAVLHPDWTVEEMAQGTADVADLAAGGDLEFRDAYQVGIVQAYGTSGEWDGEWYNPDTDEKETWYYAFRHIPGTPYQLVMGVSENEAKEAAQTLEDDLTALAIGQCVTTSIILLITCALLVVVSLWFQRRFINPVKKLRDIVTQAEKEGYKTDVDMEEEVMSDELTTLRINFKKLLTALRFNNPDYHRGDKRLELNNLRNAEAIVNETGNVRGIGVIKNNLGNLVRGMDKLSRDALPVQDRDPRVLLQAAVQNARELAADPQCWDVTEDNVGSRLLGLALARLDYGEERKAVDDLQQALKIHKDTGNWQALARLGFVLVTRLEASMEKKKAVETQKAASATESMTMQAVDKFSEEAIEQAAAVLKASGTHSLQVYDGTPLAQLLYSMSVFKNDNRYSLFALNSIMNLDPALVSRLAKQVEQESVLTAEARDLIKSSALTATAIKKKKVICFCIDRTWNPILEVCINSICTIIKDHVSEDDVVCMYGLGTGWLIHGQAKLKGGQALIRQVEAAKEVKGKCNLYKGMLETLGHLSGQGADVSKWLVVLTDLVDLEGKNPKFRYNAVKGAVGSMMKDSTLAVIDTSAISGWEPGDNRWPAFKSNMKDFVGEATSNGHGGHLLVATDLNALAAKFQEVGAMMAEADLGEHL